MRVIDFHRNVLLILEVNIVGMPRRQSAPPAAVSVAFASSIGRIHLKCCRTAGSCRGEVLNEGGASCVNPGREERRPRLPSCHKRYYSAVPEVIGEHPCGATRTG